MALNPSLGSMDSEYDLGSTHSDLSLADDPPPHGGMPTVMPASQADPTFPCLKPSNPSPQGLSSEERKAHNHSSVSFREGRRASDTSLTQGADFLLFNRVGFLLFSSVTFSLNVAVKTHLCQPAQINIFSLLSDCMKNPKKNP